MFRVLYHPTVLGGGQGGVPDRSIHGSFSRQHSGCFFRRAHNVTIRASECACPRPPDGAAALSLVCLSRFGRTSVLAAGRTPKAAVVQLFLRLP